MISMEKRNKEYDAFGPWIYEIDEEHEIPGIFRGRYNEDEASLLLFKVPRNIERRKAGPSMDLYDYLIGARDEYLHILKRNGKRVTEIKVGYGGIFAVKDMHALLKGELILFTDKGQVKLTYNTVSEEIIAKLINIIEDKISGARWLAMEGMPVECEPDRAGSVDILFYNLFHKLKGLNQGIRLVAYQPALYADGKLTIIERLKGMRVAYSTVAFIAGDKELIIIERETPGKRNVAEELAYSCLYVPYQSIRGAGSYCFDEEGGLSVAEIAAGSEKFSYVFENGNTRMPELCRSISAAGESGRFGADGTGVPPATYA